MNGDPGDEGDISLRVQERKPAVALVPGSKNVTLTRALDREEKTGPSSVYVNVRCDRRHTTDPVGITCDAERPSPGLTAVLYYIYAKLFQVRSVLNSIVTMNLLI